MKEYILSEIAKCDMLLHGPGLPQTHTHFYHPLNFMEGTWGYLKYIYLLLIQLLVSNICTTCLVLEAHTELLQWLSFSATVLSVQDYIPWSKCTLAEMVCLAACLVQTTLLGIYKWIFHYIRLLTSNSMLKFNNYWIHMKFILIQSHHSVCNSSWNWIQLTCIGNQWSLHLNSIVIAFESISRSQNY
jgi:hypothetical protein